MRFARSTSSSSIYGSFRSSSKRWNRSASYNRISQNNVQSLFSSDNHPHQQQHPQQSQQQQSHPVRRYIVTSTVLIAVALVVKVPLVSGVAGVVSQRGLLAAVGIFRLAQHPFRTVARRRRLHRLNRVSGSNKNNNNQNNYQYWKRSVVSSNNLDITTNILDSLDGNVRDLYRQRARNRSRSDCTRYRTRPNCFGCKPIMVTAFLNTNSNDFAQSTTADWICVVRGGGENEDGDDDDDTATTVAVLDKPDDETVGNSTSSDEENDIPTVKRLSREESLNNSTSKKHLRTVSPAQSQQDAASISSSDLIIEIDASSTTVASTDVESDVVPDDQSVASSVNTTEEATTAKNYTFSLYQKGDGSEEDIDNIPTRYLRMQLNDRERAKQALQATLQWRKEHNIDAIIGRPHPDYDICKTVFPHYFAGYDKFGNVAFVQRPALINLELAKKNGLSNQALLDHYVYVNEYLWQIVEADRPLALFTSIIDLYGLNFSILRQGDILSFLKVFVQTMDSHFPQRGHTTYITNAPKWFHLIYKLVSPLMRESTKAKIKIYSNGPEQDEALKAQLAPECVASLPDTFWSTKLPQQDDVDDDSSTSTQRVSTLEEELRDFTIARLKDAGVQMQEIIP